MRFDEIVCGEIQLHKLLAKDIILTPQSMSGLEFRFLRKQARLKPAELAELLGVEPRTITNWERSESLTRQTDIAVRVLLSNRLWSSQEWVDVVSQFAEMAGYAWDEVLEDSSEGLGQDISELVAQNVSFGLDGQVWSMNTSR